MKLKVKDTRGRIFKVTDEAPVEKPVKDAAELSADEIKKLKRLIPHLDDLLVLLETEKAEHGEDFEKESFDVEEDEDVEVKEEDVQDECVEEVEAEEEIEDDESEVIHDSKMSFGATERKKVSDAANSEIDRDQEVARAWAKRYNGGN